MKRERRTGARSSLIIQKVKVVACVHARSVRSTKLTKYRNSERPSSASLTVGSIWAKLDDALVNAAANVGEEVGEIGIGAKSGQRAVPKFVFS